MKLYVFFLSFVLAFLPSLSYAFAPIAIAGSTVGRVAIQTGTGAVIKKVSPNAITQLTKNGLATCIKNGVGCGAVISAMKGDGIDIEINNSTNNDIDVEIYEKHENEECKSYQEYFLDYNHDSFPGGGRSNDLASFFSSLSELKASLLSDFATSDNIRAYGYPKIEFQGYQKSKKIIDDYKSKNLVDKHDVELGRFVTVSASTLTFEAIGRDGRAFYRGNVLHGLVVVNSLCQGGKRHLSDKEIAEYFKKYADGDDITNIYNYDYSKHDNITVNNKTESGDTINNYKNDFDKTEKEKNVSANATEKMKNKRKGYDVDEINDENCEKNEKGEYDKCGDDRGKKDGEDSEEQKEDEEKKDDEKKEDDEEDKPIDCKASSFHQKVCDWIDWTQEEHEPKQNTKVDIDEPDLPNIDEDRIKFKAVCPPPKPIHLNVVGRDYHTELSYQPLCDFFSELKPFVVGLGWFSGAMIIAGRRY